MLYPVFFGDESGTLETEVVGGQGVGATTAGVLSRLEWADRGVEDFAEHEFVVADALVQVVLARREEALEVL